MLISSVFVSLAKRTVCSSVDMTRWASTLCVTSCTRERNVLLDNMCDSCKVSRNKTRYVRAGYEQHPDEVTYIVSVPSTVSGESYADRSRRVVNVMEMIRRHNRPALWKHVVQEVVVNGRLEITDRCAHRDNSGWFNIRAQELRHVRSHYPRVSTYNYMYAWLNIHT